MERQRPCTMGMAEKSRCQPVPISGSPALSAPSFGSSISRRGTRLSSACMIPFWKDAVSRDAERETLDALFAFLDGKVLQIKGLSLPQSAGGSRSSFLGVAAKLIGSPNFIESTRKIDKHFLDFMSALQQLPDQEFWSRAGDAFTKIIGSARQRCRYRGYRFCLHRPLKHHVSKQRLQVGIWR